jgi:hypothetical protein
VAGISEGGVAHPLQRLQRSGDEGDQARAADRGLLLTRVAIGLAHEGKNPLHNMVLHVQLMAEKLSSPDIAVNKHLVALRDGIGRVDALLKTFGEFASPEHLPPDLGAAAHRASLLFGYEVRRAAVQLVVKGPESLMVRSEGRYLGDIVAHAMLAGIEFARGGGMVSVEVVPQGAAAVLEVRCEGGAGNREQANAHVEAARRLTADAACELSFDASPGGVGRLSLNFLHPR